MEKPTPSVHLYYYLECKDYIKEKYLLSEDQMYSFWDFIVENREIHNGSMGYGIDPEDDYEFDGRKDGEEMKQIAQYFWNEFDEGPYYFWW